ncbi:MAG: LCP family protein [Eubacteriales bacterium]
MEKKRMSKGKVILLIFGILFLLLLVAAAVLVAALFAKYNATSYEYIAPVEREETYVMPDYPEVILDTDGTWQEGVDLETESAEMDAPGMPAETNAEEEADEAKPSTEDSAVQTVEGHADQQQPEETLAAVINNTPQSTYTPPSNPNASFANSSNVVSVYGSVPIYKVEQKDSDILNILVMGTDTRDVTADRGRSDTMIIVSYNKKEGTVKLTSLLRDSLVPIEGHDWNRLNTAYFFGGVGLAINTINQLYDLDIQNFIVIDFNGTKDFIDYIGGVDITLTEEEAALYSTYTGRSIEPGLNHMDSTLALTHMRNRTIGNDFGRTQRQRDTITAVIRQILSQKSLTDLYNIVDYSFSLIKTNISASSLVSLAASVLSQASVLQIESQNVPFDDAYQFAWYNGMSIISYDIAKSAVRLNEFIYGK